jgi:hypothetical protein
MSRFIVLGIAGGLAFLAAACGAASSPGATSGPASMAPTATPTAVPIATPTAAPVYRDACIGLTDVKRGMWGAAENAFMAAGLSAEAAVTKGDLTQYPISEDFLSLAEDAAQVSGAQSEGTSDAKALAQYNADVPLYAEYLVGCS